MPLKNPTKLMKWQNLVLVWILSGAFIGAMLAFVHGASASGYFSLVSAFLASLMLFYEALYRPN
jgi:hypothetical protein